MVSIIRLDDAETRKWAWSLIDEGRRKIAIELLGADRALVELPAALTVFVAELASLYQTSFASWSLRTVEPSGLVVIAVGQTKSGRRVSQVDWRHTVSPVAVLRNPIWLDELLADSKYVSLRQELVSGERIVRLRSWDSAGFVSALLAACDETDRVSAKAVVQAAVQESDSSHVSNILAQERDATISAMKISGVVDSLANLQNVPVDSGDPTPFLGRVESAGSGGRERGVPLIRQHEDSIIGLDARNVLDWVGRETEHAAAMVFSNRDGRQLTVINANRLGIEQAVGADLVYYSPSYRAYVLVQYKMMSAGQGSRIDPSNWRFRPDKQFRDQLVRMRNVESSQRQGDDCESAHDSYRLGQSLTYFKFCRHDTGLDAKTQLMKGSYVSTEFVDVLLASTQGPRGGQVVDGGILRDRGLDNAAFISLVRTSLIGSSGATSDELQRVVAASLAGDRSVVFAMPHQDSTS
ncbi:hypothetical protein ACFTS5_02230 [Nocardia sp. NPDC056952]|uniref:hypothetical protein n=1 Tax=Nocardia sp. NPDC056952 TaxID=3345979 RepID=UPI00363DE16B